MATYAAIQDWIRQQGGPAVKTCWIAHCKEIYGLNPGRAPNRQGGGRVAPCPESKRPLIEAASRHFGMIA
jgi:hypothetical protein